MVPPTNDQEFAEPVVDWELLAESSPQYGEGHPPPKLKDRTRTFAVRIIRLVGSLPRRMEADVIGKQVLRSGTSIGAHFREATRARSEAEFLSKIEGALMEIEETAYWLELLVESSIVEPAHLAELQRENGEILAIFMAIARDLKTRRKR